MTMPARTPAPGVEADILRVLAAESDARARIDKAREAAAERLVDARNRALAIAERTDLRLLAARQSVDARLAARQADARERAQALRETPAPAGPDSPALRAALEAVAAALTGDAP